MTRLYQYSALCGLILSISLAVQAAEGVLPGDGSAETPYRIEDYSDFMVFSTDSSYWADGVNTILMCDLNLASKQTGVSYTAAVIAPQDKSGVVQDVFAGAFDGNHHVISNLSITVQSADYIGLFGIISGENAVVKNIVLEDISLVTEDNTYHVGGICGANGLFSEPSTSTVSNCSVTGSITGVLNVGGICGINDLSIISNCLSMVSISGKENITARQIGGICGYNINGDIFNCCSILNTISDDDTSRLFGGICGMAESGTITNCYSNTAIEGNNYIGGLAGYVGSYSSDGCVILNCYSSGSVNGSSNVGGFCGLLKSGENTSISASFWDVDTSGIGSSGDDNFGATGKTTAEMQDANTFISAGWDFVNETINGAEDVWHMPYYEAGYPMLFYQRDIPGDIAGEYGVDMEDVGLLAKEWDVEKMESLLEMAEYWLAGK